MTTASPIEIQELAHEVHAALIALVIALDSFDPLVERQEDHKDLSLQQILKLQSFRDGLWASSDVVEAVWGTIEDSKKVKNLNKTTQI